MSEPLLLMLRHGETELNAQDAFRGWLNVPLTDQGRQQATEAGQFAQHYPVSLVVHSPLERAAETARIVAPHMPVEVDARLLPWNLGILAGKPKQPYMKLRDFYLDHPDHSVPNGESVESFEKRFQGILERGIAYGRSGRLALFVTHTSNIAAASGLLSGVRGRLEEQDSVEPGGVAGVFAAGNKFELRPLFKESAAKSMAS